jgi:hypothetical protein
MRAIRDVAAEVNLIAEERAHKMAVIGFIEGAKRNR